MKRESTYVFSFLVFILSSILLFNLLYRFDRQFLSRFAFLSQITANNFSHNGACDYWKGRWVWDETDGLYDEDCPFLDAGFRCRRNGRKNQSFRKWRWQPKGCEIPRYVTFVSSCYAH